MFVKGTRIALNYVNLFASAGLDDTGIPFGPVEGIFTNTSVQSCWVVKIPVWYIVDYDNSQTS